MVFEERSKSVELIVLVIAVKIIWLILFVPEQKSQWLEESGVLHIKQLVFGNRLG